MANVNRISSRQRDLAGRPAGLASPSRRRRRALWPGATLMLLLAAPACDRPSTLVLEAGPGHAVRLRGEERYLIGVSATQAVLQNANFDIDAWLDDLERHGIRDTLVWSFMAVRQHADGSESDGRWGYAVPDVTPWRRRAGGPDALDGKPQWDLGAFDEEVYWPRLEHLVAETDRRGMTLWITVFDGWLKDLPVHPFLAPNGGPLASKGHFVALEDYDRELPGPFDPAWSWQRKNQWYQERFAARLARAVVGREHVILEMFNEGEWYDPGLALEHQRHFLRFFDERLDVPLAMNADHLWGSDPWGDPRVDVVSWHTSQGYEPRAAQRRWLDGYARTPAKPVVNSETVPAFKGAGAGKVGEDDVRRLIWATLTAGGHIYVQDDSSFAFDPRAPRWDGEGMRRQLGVAARLFAGLRPAEFAPAPGLSNTGYCLASGTERLVVYAPRGGRVAVRIPPGRSYDATCLDPRSGERRDVGPLGSDDDGLAVDCGGGSESVVLLTRRDGG